MNPLAQQGSHPHRHTGIVFLIVAVVWLVVSLVSTNGADAVTVALGFAFAGIGVLFLGLDRRGQR